jgi:alpha-tubulin suppressor-like RCC1 family protein
MSQVNYKINNIDITDISVSKEYFLDSYENIRDDKKQSALWVTTNTLGVTNGALGLGPEWSSRFGSIPGQTVAGGTNWKKIAVNMYTSYAIKTDGTLWATGNNMFGQFGIDPGPGDPITGLPWFRSSPVQVGSSTNWKQVSTGQSHTVAIKTDGTLWSWGRNDRGQIGNNTIADRSSPTQIGSGKNWRQVSCGVINTYALASNQNYS